MIRHANVVGVPIGVPVFNSQASSWNRRKTHEIIAVRVHGWGIAVGWSHIVIAIAVIPPTDEARKPPEDGTELDGLQLRCISDFPFVPGSSVGCIYGSLMQRQTVCLCCDVASGVGLHVASVVWVVLLVLLYAERDLCEAGICILTWQISEFLDSDFYLVEIQIFT